MAGLFAGNDIMCEESACLVPPMDTSHNRPVESRPSYTRSPLDPSGVENTPQNGEALMGFHEDALSQASVGKAQVLLACVLGLGLAADCSELTILAYILPAAELQLCIGEDKKGWLVSITLLAMAAGSLAWGILGDHLGRRRALISALSVAALFSMVASVMPTYGTFMTARFCSGLGVSGAFPLSFSYLAETCSRPTRSRYLGVLHSFWPMGAAAISSVAFLVMPTSGAAIVEDNREHWCSWHKFLILSTVPTIVCIVGLIWASESPRYLLEASREVEALAVYQRLHRLNNSRTQYGLTELELPGRSAYRERMSPTRNIIKHGVNSFREAFQFVSCPANFRSTLLLASLHFLLGFLYTGLTTYTSAIMQDQRDHKYFSDKQYISNENYTGVVFNSTLENREYQNALFKNATFTHLLLNHVGFVNCTVIESEFIDVKASVSYFKDSSIIDSRFIDTDLTTHHFVNCSLINNTFLSVISDCTTNFDYNNHLEELHQETTEWSTIMAVALVVLGFGLECGKASRRRFMYVAMLVVGASAIGILFMADYTKARIVDVNMRVWLTCAVNALTLVVVEGYPCHLRCTAHGMMRSLFHIASLCAIPIYNVLVQEPVMFSVILTVLLALYGAFISKEIQDNSKVLL